MRKHKLGDKVIEAKDLKKHFNLSGGFISGLLGQPPKVAKALDGIDITIRSGEVVGLVGESGCGKSTLGMTLVRMHEPSSGDIEFKGASITQIKRKDLKSFRSKAQIIFQDPYSSLNPRLTIGEIVEEPLKIHQKGDADYRRMKVREALAHVRLPVEDYETRYPADLSGGQRQRVAIARALVLDPEFIVADEPVSMLDVSVQAGVLQILDELSQELGLAVLYISHDIATVGYICDQIAVMYLGRVVEKGPVQEVMRRPKHPYTQSLMQAIPNTDPLVRRERVVLEGDVPTPIDTPPGCRFASRCPSVVSLCNTQEPNLYATSQGSATRCHLFGSLAEAHVPVGDTQVELKRSNAVAH